MVGKTVGHYEILEPLGAGGMGEVYRARDTKLDRDVAIKVLPEDFADDPERLARLEREAKLLAALNHPNIATVHALEGEEGSRFLVLELVKGESLAQKLAKGPLPVEKALDVCKQIAEALEAAHGEGIIHRDLKPANVLVTPDGRAKVLDFGIAKTVKPDDDMCKTAQATDLTVAGTIVGTAPYMSPEQVRGQQVDKRTDIWSFGCVMYEVLSGKKAFARETVADTLAAVIDVEPDWSSLPTRTPDIVHSLLRRCVQKDRNKRLHDVADARIEIEEGLREPESMPPTAAPLSTTTSFGRWTLLWGVAVLASVITGLSVWIATRPLPPHSAQTIRLPGILEPPLAALDSLSFALSRDGSKLVYVGESGPDRQLYLRRLDRLDATPIPSTGGATSPFFSPDGREVAFFTSGRLRKVSLEDGVATPLATFSAATSSPALNVGAWGGDGTIVFSSATGPLMRVPATGGEPVEATTLDRGRGEVVHLLPQILPDGEHVLFTSSSRLGDVESATIEIESLSTGERIHVREGAYFGRYVPSGHLVFVREAVLFATPFDLERLTETGPPRVVLESFYSEPANGVTHLSFSDSGTLVYATGGREVTTARAVFVDHDGNVIGRPLEVPRAYYSPRFSPDGRQLSMHIGGEFFSRTSESEVWVKDLNTGTMRPVTTHPAPEFNPVWTPDGQRLTFSSERANGVPNLFWKRADGQGDATQLADSDSRQYAGSWSPDGRTLIFIQASPLNDFDIWALSIDEIGLPSEAEILVQSEFNDWRPEMSPDGRWLAYSSADADGSTQVYVQPLAGGQRVQISAGDGSYVNIFARWSSNPREIYYRDRNRMMVVAYSIDGGTFQPERPRLLFEGMFEDRGWPDWDVSPDGQTFVLFQREDASGTGGAAWSNNMEEFVFVFNWHEELTRLVPLDGSQ